MIDCANASPLCSRLHWVLTISPQTGRCVLSISALYYALIRSHGSWPNWVSTRSLPLRLESSLNAFSLTAQFLRSFLCSRILHSHGCLASCTFQHHRSLVC